MTRGGRGRRGSRAGEAPAAATGPAAALQAPLSDVSNSARPTAAPALKSPAAATRAAPPSLAATVPLPLPGLEVEGLPAEPRGRLPVAEQTFEAFGDALGCLRVTSLTRSVSARRHSLLRLVQQPGEAEGRRAHSLPPAERPMLRAHTQPLPDGGAASRHRSRRRGSRNGVPSQEDSGTEAVCAPSQEQESVGHGSLAQPSAAAACSPTASGEVAPPGAPPTAAVTDVSASEAPAPTSLLPPPLPVMPGATGAAASPMSSTAAEAAVAEEGAEGRQEVQQQLAAGSEPAAAERPHGLMAEAVFNGLSAAEEAAALPSEAPPPSWLVQQGCSNVTGEHVEPCPALSVQAQQAATLWRAQWTSGLQWHNAMRAGGPLRLGSKLPFVPLDPNEPVLEVLMFRAAVMPADVVAGAARFQDIVFGEPALHSQALEEGVLRFGLWGMPSGGGTYTLVAGGSPLALPLSFRRASPQLLALFLACVWTEANNQEAAQVLAYSFGAGGERSLDESTLKYPVNELQEWLHLATGGGPSAASSAALAALSTVAVFGTE
ncbi:hypothetical protein C2E21_4466 [Chlorella sorokiniana]|uniref:Uncharacterized protein n=1 Tax=Chlorella sorokiniana TaxID=3076 RepID=A0A2P6TR32_CHLSO|nr:hypothetical protein C2E21_4466 [Chlorella sorokiniana]|eukprot:PRW56525.1 hypothetical protein C2E21_4466 [Chlorella sorokiniana]